MSPETLFVLSLILVSSLIAMGIVFIRQGNKRDENNKCRKPGLMIAGWIIVGTVSLLATAGFIFLVAQTSFLVGILFLFMPFIILLVFIISLAIGITYLIFDYRRNEEGHFDMVKIRIGWISVGINTTIIAVLFTLLLMFMTGIIPIRLM